METTHIFLTTPESILTVEKTDLFYSLSDFTHYAKVIVEGKKIYKVAIFAQNLQKATYLLQKCFETYKFEIKFIKPVKPEENKNEMN